MIKIEIISTVLNLHALGQGLELRYRCRGEVTVPIS